MKQTPRRESNESSKQICSCGGNEAPKFSMKFSLGTLKYISSFILQNTIICVLLLILIFHTKNNGLRMAK